jgi:hypothetical protein
MTRRVGDSEYSPRKTTLRAVRLVATTAVTTTTIDTTANNNNN